MSRLEQCLWGTSFLGSSCPGYESSWARVFLAMICLWCELSWVHWLVYINQLLCKSCTTLRFVTCDLKRKNRISDTRTHKGRINIDTNNIALLTYIKTMRKSLNSSCQLWSYIHQHQLDIRCNSVALALSQRCFDDILKIFYHKI